MSSLTSPYTNERQHTNKEHQLKIFHEAQNNNNVVGSIHGRKVSVKNPVHESSTHSLIEQADLAKKSYSERTEKTIKTFAEMQARQKELKNQVKKLEKENELLKDQLSKSPTIEKKICLNNLEQLTASARDERIRNLQSQLVNTPTSDLISPLMDKASKIKNQIKKSSIEDRFHESPLVARENSLNKRIREVNALYYEVIHSKFMDEIIELNKVENKDDESLRYRDMYLAKFEQLMKDLKKLLKKIEVSIIEIYGTKENNNQQLIDTRIKRTFFGAPTFRWSIPFLDVIITKETLTKPEEWSYRAIQSTPEYLNSQKKEETSK